MTATSSPAEPPESTLAAAIARLDAPDVRTIRDAARIAHLEAALAAAEARLLAVEALADEWEATVYKLPPGYPMTVNEFCRYWFKAPIRAALAAGG